MNLFCTLVILIGMMVCGPAWAAPLTVVAFGDSTTANRKDTEIYAKVLQERLGIDAVTILNKGIRRHTTSMANRWFERDVTTHAPDVVIIQFGINDSIIDVWAAYDDFEKETGRSASELLPDGMHPNTEGHQLVADLLEPLLRKAVEEKKKSSQPTH